MRRIIRELNDLKRIKSEYREKEDNYSHSILVCAGAGCVSSNCYDVSDAVKDEIARLSVSDSVRVIETGCMGTCAVGPVMLILPERVFYTELTPETAREVVRAHLIDKKILEEHTFYDHSLRKHVPVIDDIEFFKNQVRIALRNCGQIEHASIEAYIEEETEMNNPQITITMEDGGVIVAELYPDKAPNTVNNFIYLVEEGFYDGVIFHRVIENFMIQGGDPEGTGRGGPGYSIKGEFYNNNFPLNDIVHERGVLSMARTPMPDSAGSQFFIMVEDSPHLDNDYAAFGRVIEGMDVVDAIVSVDTDRNDKPLVDQRIATITVDTFGVEYPEPVKIGK